jgi:hypothetical protein
MHGHTRLASTQFKMIVGRNRPARLVVLDTAVHVARRTPDRSPVRGKNVVAMLASYAYVRVCVWEESPSVFP